MKKTEIIDDVKVTTDEDGSQHFEPVEQLSKTKNYDSFWQKLCNWIFGKDEKIQPYVKIRDLSDPIGKRETDPFDDGSGSKAAGEIGIKIKF